MANFKRSKPRARTSSGYGRRNQTTNFLNHWPSWWDIIYHTRPRRVAEHRIERDIMIGRVDPDAIVWPLGNSKPHHYYW